MLYNDNKDLVIVWAYKVNPVKLGSHLNIYSICKLIFQILRLYYKYRKPVLIVYLLLEIFKIIKNKVFKVYLAVLIS
jgi:hypothetical protein